MSSSGAATAGASTGGVTAAAAGADAWLLISIPEASIFLLHPGPNERSDHGHGSNKIGTDVLNSL